MTATVCGSVSAASGDVTAVRQRLVRKSNANEVLVTAWKNVSATQHVTTVRWPVEHPFYMADADFYSPLLFTESVRQSLSMVTHTAFDIPLEHRLALDHFRTSVDCAALRRGTEPVELYLRTTHTRMERRRLGAARGSATVEVWRDAMPVGTAQIGYTASPPAIYDRLRGSEYANATEVCARTPAAPAAEEPLLVGRESARDVVLSPTGEQHRWLLRNDLTHPVLFDHPHDHVPGMVLMEAASQAAQAVLAPGRMLPVSLDTTFSRYVELDKPCWITAERLSTAVGWPQVNVTAVQDDRTAFTSTVTVAPIMRNWAALAA
ncbi:hypothetical protein FE633_23510 [Streptomyces montanus]|uniref:A-factor biosynthesis hotdog domain-containing protein n=1 Tax=Streptomyces montanus TaxID=2580423 RepID=A0A5R9FKG2_9ACTN|nr:ScbA/BarX family gamma-butyrolactone biosynthesis protein [Streptomyces montanus]TLS43771.1 hypothetical protein FE633_23510 [Streptomyces montanus]